MAKVFLRVYNREIESMIEGGQLDEAVAHCQHILKTFPMHIDTYRLLGKAFLEGRRYADAADIFQRVLMAVPDDFVSHVGMSIIRDDENILDDAIWHMERAFEVQPSNSAIQGELRRLYGRRDGVEPSKIRLSRDALANMYSQGELFNQAIAEIRSVLAEDTNRPDLQVMLARAYYRSGQKVEAAEMAATLLKKYPYCMDALRVLVDVLPGTARAENTQVYQQRLHMLDPYSSFAMNSVFASDQVVDSAVNLERLEYRPGSTFASFQPDWASSLGIKLNDEKRTETPPDWMQKADTPKQSVAYAAESSASEAASATVGATEGVPDWMRTAGWQEPAEAVPEGSVDSAGALPDELIARADIPEWLKSMAPAEVTEEANLETDEPVESLSVGADGIPEWLKPADSTEAAEAAQPEAQNPVESQPVGGEDVPEWFTSTDPAASGAETPVEPQQPVEPQPQPAGEDTTPEWLKSLVQEEVSEDVNAEPQLPVEPQLTGEEDVPDWLKSMASAEATEGIQIEPQQPAEPVQTSVEPQSEAEEVVPDWSKSTAAAETTREVQGETQPPIETQPGPVQPQPVGEVAAPDWLEPSTHSGVTEGAHVEGQEPAEVQQAPVESQSLEEGAIPDWLKSSIQPGTAEGAYMEPPMPVELHGVGEDNIPDWLKATTPADTTDVSNVVPEPAPAPAETASTESEPGSITSDTQPVSAEGMPDWMAGAGARADAAAMTSKAMEQSGTGELPVSENPAPQEPVDQTQSKLPPPEVAATGESFQPAEEAKPLTIGDDALGWLESLAAKQGAKPEELLTNPQDRPAEMPDWLRQPGGESADVPETLPPESLTGFDAVQSLKPVPIVDEALSVKPEVPLPEPPAETPAQPADQAVGDEDETMAWLGRLAAERGTKPEEQLASPRDNQGTLPDWIQKAQADQPVVPEPEEVPPAKPEPAAEEADISLTSWLSKVDVNEALEKRPEETPGEASTTTPEEELPDWLKDLENPAAPSEAPKAGDELPEWLRHPISSSEPEPAAPVPGLDSTQEPESEMPAWMDENVPVAGHTVPTMPGEWLPADVKAPAIPDSSPAAEAPVSGPVPTAEAEPIIGPTSVEKNLPAIEPVSAAEPVSFSVRPTGPLPTLKQTGMLSHIPVQDKDAELLSSAQDVLDQNSLDDAMRKYTKLIKKGRLLDEVIHDLREALYRYPVDVIVWQTLGDAYMRANRLQDALDAYTKAEELLR